MVVLLTSACGSHTSVPLLSDHLSTAAGARHPLALPTGRRQCRRRLAAASLRPRHGRHCASPPRPGGAPRAPPCGNRRRQWAGSGGVGRRAPRACLAGGRSSTAGTQGCRPCLGPSWGRDQSSAAGRQGHCPAAPPRPCLQGAWPEPARSAAGGHGRRPAAPLGPTRGRGRSSAWALPGGVAGAPPPVGGGAAPPGPCEEDEERREPGGKGKEKRKRKERKRKKKKKKEKEERGERLTGGTHMLTSSKTTVKTSKGVICTVLRVEGGNMSGFVVQGGILDFFTSSGG